MDRFGITISHVVKDQSGQELVHLLDAISTNFTFFFREQEHFAYLRSEILPALMERKRNNGRGLRFWSAGCSSGEEPYSIAITLLEEVKNPQGWSLSILATDISTKVLKIAESGVFHKERVQSIPSPDGQEILLERRTELERLCEGEGSRQRTYSV